MRRAAIILLVLLAGGLVIAWPALGGDDDTVAGDYRVRAYFDNGSFVVPGEEVRIAGAKVGTVEDVDVSRDDEVVTLENGGRAIPGKAVIVLSIADGGFKDFRQDASCIIRPQSLIGERFVDCTPTQPRAPGTEPPPELEQIEDGERGEGEYFLPVENNGKSVDLDLVQNIMRYPYRERLRLIFNDLGAAVAGRGEDIGEIIDRANPALRATDRVLAILAQQNRQLAELAANGDAVLEPLARERESVTGFLHNAAVAGSASAERSDDLEAGLQKLPRTLREVRLTMTKLRRFGREGTPLFADLEALAPDLNLATKKLAPFARAATPALTSLGDAAEKTGPRLVEADDLIVDLRALGKQAEPSSKALKKTLFTLSKTNGIRHLANALFNVSASVNGYDSLGHLLRGNLLVTACVEYQSFALPGCVANWGNVAGAAAAASPKARLGRIAAGVEGGALPASIEQLPELEPVPPLLLPDEQTQEGPDTSPGPSESPGAEPSPEAGQVFSDEEQAGASGLGTRGTRHPLEMDQAEVLLGFLLGSGS